MLYHAKIHPEQYCNTLAPAQIKQLHTSLRYVTGLAVDTLSDSSKFPEEWLFKHRWGKGKKDAANKLPNGEKIVFLTVGGRTSAVVPTIQKKTGPVAGDISGNGKSKKDGKRKRTVKKEESEEDESEAEEAEEHDDEEKEDTKPKKKLRATPAKKSKSVKSEPAENPLPPQKIAREAEAPKKGTAKSRMNEKKVPATGGKPERAKKEESEAAEAATDTGRRRSGRLSRG